MTQHPLEDVLPPHILERFSERYMDDIAADQEIMREKLEKQRISNLVIRQTSYVHATANGRPLCLIYGAKT